MTAKRYVHGVESKITAANQPTWGAANQPFPVLAAGLAAGGDAGCYRYRAFETVVPLRNMIWR